MEKQRKVREQVERKASYRKWGKAWVQDVPVIHVEESTELAETCIQCEKVTMHRFMGRDKLCLQCLSISSSFGEGLKECPVCGGIHSSIEERKGGVLIRCVDCNFSCYGVGKIQHAIYRWNKTQREEICGPY